MDWRGRATEREVKLQFFSNFSASHATLTMDRRGRATEREVKLQLLGFPQGCCATLRGDWRGRACEREVRLQLFRFPQGSRAYEAIERSDDKHRVEIHVESIESQVHRVP